jgi:hypothetical protein
VSFNFIEIIFFLVSVSISWDDCDESPKEDYFELSLNIINDIHFINTNVKFESFLNQIIDVSFNLITFNNLFYD